MYFKNIKKKICKPKVLKLRPNVCDSQKAVFRIHDILGWIQIRIRGSMPLNSGSGSYYFCMIIEGSGSKRTKNTWILWIRIRIRNTAKKKTIPQGMDLKIYRKSIA